VKAQYDPVAGAAYRKEHYKKTAEEQRKRCRRYYAKHRKKIQRQKQKRRAENEEVRAAERRRTAKRRAIDLEFRIMKCMRARLSRAVRSPNRAGSAVRDIGCSIEFFKQYIASKFLPWMTWDNWTKKWQLDHIKPLASFDLTDREQFLAACHYTNLQPLGILAHHRKTAEERRRI